MVSHVLHVHPNPFSSAPRGCRVENIPSDLRTWDGWFPRDCLNLDPPPPPGWYSIPHWAALTEWGLFDSAEATMEETLSEWMGDPWQVEALRYCEEEGISPIEWPAPRRMRIELGIAAVLIFPDPILREVFLRPSSGR